MKIIVSYIAIDGCKNKKTYKTLKGAQEFAQKWVGETPSLGGWYAVSDDGIGKITVEGCSLKDLFPKLAAEAAMLAEMEEESAAREAYLRGDLVPPKKAPAVKYSFDTVEEAEEAYEWAMESWHECYAEAGSSWVFGEQLRTPTTPTSRLRRLSDPSRREQSSDSPSPCSPTWRRPPQRPPPQSKTATSPSRSFPCTQQSFAEPPTRA